MKKFGIAITVAVAAMMSTTSSFASGVGNACDIDSGILKLPLIKLMKIPYSLVLA